MMCAKFFSLSLVVFTLLGCNQSSVDTRTNYAAEASTISQQHSSFSTNLSKIQAKEFKPGKMIGPAFDCDNDGQRDDARVDYDGDGIPDECVIGDEKPQAQIDDSSYENAIDSLEKLTKDCEETQRTKGNIKYTVCIINGQPVKASESISEIGDGLGFWFDNGKVRAIQRFHSQELFIFDNQDNIKSVFHYNRKTGKMEKLATITNAKSQFTPETLQETYKNILRIFNL